MSVAVVARSFNALFYLEVRVAGRGPGAILIVRITDILITQARR